MRPVKLLELLPCIARGMATTARIRLRNGLGFIPAPFTPVLPGPCPDHVRSSECWFILPAADIRGREGRAVSVGCAPSETPACPSH
jgi:hypothetical protein